MGIYNRRKGYDENTFLLLQNVIANVTTPPNPLGICSSATYTSYRHMYCVGTFVSYRETYHIIALIPQNSRISPFRNVYVSIWWYAITVPLHTTEWALCIYHTDVANRRGYLCISTVPHICRLYYIELAFKSEYSCIKMARHRNILILHIIYETCTQKTICIYTFLSDEFYCTQ